MTVALIFPRGVKEHHGGRHWRHWVVKPSQLHEPVRVDTVVTELAIPSILEVFAQSGSVVTEKPTNVLLARESCGHRV